MRGGRLIFYLSVAFICGNLLFEYISSSFSELLLLSASAILIAAVLILLSIAVSGKTGSLALFLTLLFATGALLASQNKYLGPRDPLGSLSKNEFFTRSRAKFEKRIEMIIPSSDIETFNVLKALSVGDKSNIPRRLKQSYRASGAMHLLALSGLHVGILYSVLSFFLSFLGKGRYGKIIRGAISLPALWFYAVFTGASPSICRAVIMATVYEAGKLSGRDSNGFNSLAISAFVITIINPDAPSQISFQLSYSAMLGIFTIFPILQKTIQSLTSNTIVVKIWDLAALSISCQIFTAPLTLYYFDSFTMFSLLTNILSMPLTGIVMTMIPVSIVSAGIPWIGNLSSSILSKMIWLLNETVDIISKLQ